MAKCLYNKLRLIFNSKFLVLCSLLSILSFIFFCILYPDSANSGPYLLSAHGDATNGVLRTSLSSAPNNYGRGNCAHCHEQHRSIGGAEPAPDSPAGPDFYLLFQDLWTSPIQSSVFCYGCHTGAGSYQSGLLKNYSYSYRAGGDSTLTCPDNIYQSFQFGGSSPPCGSSVGSAHGFADFAPIAGYWGFSPDTDKINPCSACHNPHKAKKYFPCSRPSAHADIYAWDVWGDDSGEKMSDYTAFYLAPCKYPHARLGPLCESGSEPGSATLPNYVGLCTDCHTSTRLIYSTRLSRNLYQINWSAAGDFHGGQARIDNGGDFSGPGEYGDLLDPYKSGGMPNYVLSCTDCHEPHGSPNEFLLRRTVNGSREDIISGNGLWYNWCQTCHSINLPFTPAQHLPPVYSTTNCFNAGACHRHCDGVACSSNNLF